MNIGTFALKNGQLIGSIATLTVDLARLGLRPVESDNEKAPAFEIMALNVARKWVQVGALWEATSNSTGEVFYQGSLDDPSLPEKMAIMVFGDDEDGVVLDCEQGREGRTAIVIRRYVADCPICDAETVMLARGGAEFPGRIVGRCRNSPREHVFSFDRVTLEGAPLRQRCRA